MDKKLLRDGVIKYLAGVILVGMLLFLPAGTLKWTGGWMFMGALFIPMLVMGIVMYIKAPELLRSRLNSREKQGDQKKVVGLGGLMFIAAFITAGLNRRFGWMETSDGISAAACAVFLIAYAMYAEVLRENEYLSRTIQVKEGQKVVDTGMYSVVRHPMYCVTMLMFLTIPVILGSPVSLGIMLLYIPIIVKRILGEEKVLERELEGYTEYEQKVRHRLLPMIW